MGWKTFFHKTFEQEFSENKNWGDFAPLVLWVGDKTYYCVGFHNAASDWKYSPKIGHPQGVKTRIRIKYFVWISADSYGKTSIGIVYYKDGETAKDPQGYDIHGVAYEYDTPASENISEEKELVFEYDGANKITIYHNGEKFGEVTLEIPLTSFAIAIKVDEAYGNQDVGILIYEVSGEYYDQWEDIVNMIYGVMQWMMPLMIVLMIIPLIVSALRPSKKKEEERKIIVVPG